MDYLKDAAKVLWCVVQCFCFLSEVIFRLYSLSQKEKCFHYLHMKNAKCAFDKFDDQIEKVDLRTKSILRVVSGFWQILKGKFSYLSILITERNSSIELQLYLPKVSYGLPHTHQNNSEDLILIYRLGADELCDEPFIWVTAIGRVPSNICLGKFPEYDWLKELEDGPAHLHIFTGLHEL